MLNIVKLPFSLHFLAAFLKLPGDNARDFQRAAVAPHRRPRVVEVASPLMVGLGWFMVLDCPYSSSFTVGFFGRTRFLDIFWVCLKIERKNPLQPLV